MTLALHQAEITWPHDRNTRPERMISPPKAIMTRIALFASLVIVMTAATATAQTTSPYTGQEQRTIKGLSDEDIRDLLEGRGMGLAKAAELNSYPGPLHVLQVANELGLSDAQRRAADALYANMRQRALSLGRQIIEAERTLDRAFVNGEIEPALLRSQVHAIATLQGELRAVHLEAHLAQRSLLTPEQIAHYDMLRGYRGNSTPHNNRRHGG
jgi:Spy/CpxP family protein refolding chaperone